MIYYIERLHVIGFILECLLRCRRENSSTTLNDTHPAEIQLPGLMASSPKQFTEACRGKREDRADVVAWLQSVGNELTTALNVLSFHQGSSRYASQRRGEEQKKWSRPQYTV
jgi:hypothetical protein